MRRSSLKLVLASTLPLAISACSKTEEVTARQTYPTVQACVDQKVPVDVCSDAYIKALADYRRTAPTYDNAAACEADFVPDYCQQNSDGKFMPKLGGFELALSGNVPTSQLEAAKAQATQSGGDSAGGFNGSGLLMGMLIGNMLSGNGGGGRYYSQPVYQSRDSRGAYQTSTLSRQIEQGKTFGNSTQARSSSTGSYTQSTLGRSLGNSSVSSSVSRGGFGSQATARSGWGGKSSGSSFGG
ncbi:MAG: hypothetical protein JWR17_4936 [Pseudomonas sp.]|jgi:uncharacterized protein YgiB involved in biofilm formation|uniref:DUF1190 domain-containing protein n=1 Tax=Pseudomonas sp. TaxID=306 RepID=UPI002613B092|nr:DUF1190 domain-containing protein [Pseudomonas sp.]MDB6052190.1 hypothetical protein [Pseudomonas sp.]